MPHLSQVPLKTYSNRRARAQASSHAGSSKQLSSPLKDLQDQQDVTFSEMSRRMKKRALNVFNAPVPHSAHLDASQRLAKKLKPYIDPATDAMSSSPEAPLIDDMLPLQNQNINEASFQTPRPTLPSDYSMLVPNSEPTLPEQFSPLPTAHLLRSRTSSRNFKENNSERGLHSPFSSRPGSRAASPVKGLAEPGRRPRLHGKSRTLSVSMLKHSKSTAALRSPNFALDKQTANSCPDSDAPYAMQLQPATAHNRTASIPTMSSAFLDQISQRDWLVPAKALSRSPQSLHEELDVFQADHPSFYFDVPAQISTPARKKRTLIDINTHRASIYSDDSDIDIPDSDDSPETKNNAAMRALVPASPRRPGRRRRTIMHAPSDSIFSSGLDFSAYVTDEESPSHIRRTKGGRSSTSASHSRTNGPAPLGVSLDEAFSPAPPLSLVAPSGGSLPTPLPSPRPNSISSCSQHSLSRHIKRPSSTPDKSPDSSGDELHDMFSVLGLDEKDLSDVDTFDDSGIGLSKTHRRAPEVEANQRDPQTRHMRKRGDTIRASDFARPSCLSASPSGASVAVARNTRATRRTRSGTVTMASVSTQSTSSASTSGNGSDKVPGSLVARVRSEMQKHKRRHQGWPTIKMKIDDEPLPQQASDEDDDELLLTGPWTED